MFGAIPFDIMIKIANSNGCYYQLPLFETPPKLILKEEHCCSIFSGYTIEYNEHGHSSSCHSQKEHPAFSAIRNWLASRNFINKCESYSNGDIVLKEFFINDHFFNIGDTFYCASALKYTLFKQESEKLTSGIFFNTPNLNSTDDKKQDSFEW